MIENSFPEWEEILKNANKDKTVSYEYWNRWSKDIMFRYRLFNNEDMEFALVTEQNDVIYNKFYLSSQNDPKLNIFEGLFDIADKVTDMSTQLLELNDILTSDYYILGKQFLQKEKEKESDKNE